MTADSNSHVKRGPGELDSESIAAIRDLLASEETAAAAPKRKKRAKPEPQVVPEAPPKQAALAPLGPEPTPGPAERRAEMAPAKDGIVARMKARVLGYRPTPRHIVLGALALLVIFRPWLVLGLVLLSAFVLTGIFLILGYDGFWRRVMGVARWYARKHPSRSAEVHRKLDNFAMKFDAFLDRFPEGSVDGLYLPDFGDLAEADRRHDEALDRRFESLRET